MINQEMKKKYRNKVNLMMGVLLDIGERQEAQILKFNAPPLHT